MESKKDNATTGTNVLTFKDGDGLFLRGLVVSAEKQEREWENERYNQLKATIVDGKSTYFYIATDKTEALPNVLVGVRVAVRVTWAQKEKGIMTVRGELNDE